jgi:hypothetical protein
MEPTPRRHVLRALGTLPFWGVASGSARNAPTVPAALGYLPWWMAEGFAATPWRSLERVALFDLAVQPDGRLVEREWARRLPGLATQSAGSGMRFDMALTLLTQEAFDRLFADAEARERLLAGTRRWIDNPAVAGVHLDIEAFSGPRPQAIAGFRAWLQALDDARRSAGKSLSAFFPASDEFAPYDGASAARIDFWVAQVYDAHAKDTRLTGPLVTRMPGNPVSAPRALARLTSLGVARRAILLSVPLYGWEWSSESDQPGAPTHGAARLLTFAPTPRSLMPNDRRVASELAQRHGLRRDREHTPYYAYREGRQWIQGWYEDLPSLTRKLAPERAQGYAGLAFFALGYDRGEIVDAMLRWWRSGGR